jgi:uncharacterized protein with HEPN domain
MPLSAAKDDRAHLHDMLESAKQAASYVSGQTFEQFWDDPKTRDAVAMRLTIVGEAARNVSLATATAIPAVPFHQIRGLRNLIAHTYDQVDFREVWKITQNDLKPLISELERYLQKLKQQQDEAARIRQIQLQTIQPPRPSNGPKLGL